ncbi:hypothetical protein ACFO1B_55410 [Dactylosporangium siamense]|uniref:Bacterial transcriptional activator domain-containing protein n=1 Tax=Dactylosporangium siamense TaxID=685454 RepID=A0A919Q3C5_9ACTN|nr:bacterial transcriptional activator domain-containing protein [Dactylosporangium siamense]GIG53120.1 hypothetical protein Dsi01nite_111610 [Dactylosporangium siamense]
MKGGIWLVRQLARVVIGGVVFLAVLVGMPWLLLSLTRRVLADPPDATMLVNEPLSAATLVLFVLVGAWAFWGWLLVGAVLEAVDRMRHPGRRRLRPPAPLYASVSAVVGTVALLLDGFAHAAAGPHPAGNGTAGDVPAVASPRTGGVRALHAGTSAANLGIGVGGVDVGGAGWLPLPAAAAGAVSAWIWAQRRRQYQPQPPRDAHRDDPDLAPLLARPDTDGRVTIGVADGHWLDLAGLPAGGVHLAGPGGLSALRGLLITVLAAAAGSDSGPVVVITADDLRSLVGIDDIGVAALHVVESPDAIPGIGAALARGGRRVLVVRSRTGLPRGWLDEGDRAGLTVVSVDAEPSLPSWHVSADGTVVRPAVRLAVLNAAAAAVVLAGLRRIAPPLVPPPDEAPPITVIEDLPQPVAATSRRLRVTIFGPVRVESITAEGAGTVVPLRRTASLHLLLFLAVHRGGATNDDLATAIWPDQPVHIAARRLATSLWELRQALQHATGVDVVRRDVVLGGGTRHRIDPAHVEVDLWQFHDLLDAAGSAAARTERRALLRQAADLERGELAEGLTGEWLAPAREATVRHCIDALTYLAEAEADHGTALTLLHRAARLAPDNEAVQRAVLRRHASADDLDGVRRVYNALRDRCAARSDLPEPATVQLFEDLTDAAVTASTGAGAPERTPR